MSDVKFLLPEGAVWKQAMRHRTSASNVMLNLASTLNRTSNKSDVCVCVCVWGGGGGGGGDYSNYAHTKLMIIYLLISTIFAFNIGIQAWNHIS